MTENTKKDATRIKIGPVRLSYTYLSESIPRYNDDGEVIGRGYSTQILIKKSDKKTLTIVKRAIQAAATKKFGAERAAKLMKTSTFKKALRDPETEEGRDTPEYEGCLFMNVTTNDKRPVGHILRNGTVLTDPADKAEAIYSGVWALVTLNAAGFDKNGSKGVAFFINNVMKHHDDERLDGAHSAEDDFADDVDEEFEGDDFGGDSDGDDDDDDDWGF